MRDTITTPSGRVLRDVGPVMREARRLVGLERTYRCDACANEHRSWVPLRACPDCGDALPFAVIRRAALA